MNQPLLLKELLTELFMEHRLLGDPEQPISGVTWDFQQVQEQGLYFCLEEEEFQEPHIQGNSLNHLPEALEKGASVVVAAAGKVHDLAPGITLVEIQDPKELNKALALITKAFYRDPFHQMKMIGITGTNGKTTTSQMIDAILQNSKRRTGVIGTVGVFYPSGKQKAGHLSNPMATELFPIGDRMRSEEVEFLVMEVTSHAMVFERNHALDFDIAIFTNLSQDHLDFHKSFTEYKKSKLKHFQLLGKGSKKAYGIVNLDEPEGMEFIEAIDPKLRQTGKVEILTYGIRNPRADLVAYPQEITGSGSRLKISFRGEELCNFFLPMPGHFNISNALAAFLAGFASGLSIEKIQEGLEKCHQIDGRFEKLITPSDFNVYVDYAHTPDALDKILQSVRQVTRGRLILVFGCGGDRDRGKRPLMGRIGRDKADFLVVTSDNPRGEDPQAILDEIVAPLKESELKETYRILDRKKAIHQALSLAKTGDSVLIAGKGHETYQEIQGVRHPFSDREAALSFFERIATSGNPDQGFTRARLEVDLGRMRRNWELIFQDKPESLKVCAVIKDDALGHGMIESARLALQAGANMLAVAVLSEALELRQAGIERAPILVFGERTPEELELALSHDLTLQIQSVERAQQLSELALAQGKRAKVHFKVDTGMGRYGVRWSEAAQVFERIHGLEGLEWEGIMTHLAQSDEAKKDYANLQIDRFKQVLTTLEERNLRPPLAHACNSGGYLDLPHAHFEMVRLGILPTGVYPSKVCRRINLAGEELQPAMSLKARVSFVKELQAGDSCGYGMHFTAEGPTKLAILAMGYGDGYPRLRNQGGVLIQGRFCPLRGGNSMDAMLIDVSELESVSIGEEAVLLGRQETEEITAMMLQDWSKSVTYDVMSRWTKRLKRIHTDQ